MKRSSRKSVNVEMFINKSHLKKFVNSNNKRISARAIDVLNGIIRNKITNVVGRMGSRKTIMWDDVG